MFLFIPCSTRIKYSDHCCSCAFLVGFFHQVRADLATPAQRQAAVGLAFPSRATTGSFRADDIELLLLPRPGLCAFLTALASRYDFSFCTMGTKEYAAEIFRLLRELYPELPWSRCREVVSSDHSRVHTNRARGHKDLRQVFAFAHWPRWRNTTVIVDDTVDVWQADHHPLLYRISEFLGPTAASAVATAEVEDVARRDMDTGLRHCWNVLRRVHAMFFEVCAGIIAIVP